MRAAARESPLKTDGAPLSGAPAVEGGEGAAFAGEDMRPANLSHPRSPGARAGEVVVSTDSLADQTLCR